MVILGTLWMIIANGATLLGARAILHRVRTERPSDNLVLFLLIRLALISAAVLLSGIARVMTSTGLGLAGAAALAVLLATGAHRRLPRWTRPDIGLPTALFACLVLLRLLLQAWFFAPFLDDTLTYHLPKVAGWVQDGAITREVGADMRSYFPAGFELIEIWWTVFPHHDVLIEVAGLEFMLLGAAATFALAKHLELKDRSAFFASLLYVMTPGIHLQATGCMNDAPVAALVLATAALLTARAHPGVVLMAVGLGIGVKPIYAYALPGLAILFRRGSSPCPSRSAPVLLAALGLAIGLTWYGRNATLFGSPFYPIGTPEYQKVVGEIQYGPHLTTLRDNFMRLIDSRIYDRLNPYRVDHHHVSNWGAAAFSIGLVALLVALRSDAKMRRLAAAFAVSMGLVFLLVTSDPWFMRFVLFFPALLMLAIARLMESHPRLGIVAGAALALQFVGTLVPGDLPIGAVKELVTQSSAERQSYRLPDPRPPGAAVGVIAGRGMKYGYLLYGPDYSRRVVYLRPSTAEELLESMARENLKFIYSTGESRPVAECFEGGRFLRHVGGFYELK